MNLFNPDTADLKDATPRKWTCVVVGVLRKMRFSAGTVIEVWDHGYSPDAKCFITGEFQLEDREGTNADAASWLNATLATKTNLDRTLNEAKALAEPTWATRMGFNRSR